MFDIYFYHLKRVQSNLVSNCFNAISSTNTCILLLLNHILFYSSNTFEFMYSLYLCIRNIWFHDTPSVYTFVLTALSLTFFNLVLVHVRLVRVHVLILILSFQCIESHRELIPEICTFLHVVTFHTYYDSSFSLIWWVLVNQSFSSILTVDCRTNNSFDILTFNRLAFYISSFEIYWE